MDTRRDFIKKAALLTGAAGLASVLPASVQRALAIQAAEGSTYLDAEHIVILMQENRSFDHVYGTLRGVRGYNDPRAIDLPNKNKVWLQSNEKGETYCPFHLDIKETKSTWMHSLPHSWKNQVNARNDGKFDQWLIEKRNSTPEYAAIPQTMGYHNRADAPFYYALADAFTVCDQNFCSALTGTNPNRLHFWTGTVREQQNENSRALVWNDDMDYGTLHWTTFPERLEAAGVSWKCYQNEVAIDTGFQGEEDPWLSNFQDNPLEFFAQYNIQAYPKHLEFQKKDTSAFDKLTDYQKSIHQKAFVTNTGDPHHRELIDLTYDDNGTERTLKVPKGDVLYQFREDVRTGQLPLVSWVTAPENFSDHPTAPWYGAWYVSEVLDILTQNPEVWKKTIFILAYDENDGYFDHVPPFTAPHSHKPGTGKVSEGIDTRREYVTLDQELERHDFPEKFQRECSIGLGFRVPLVIASPWSKGGWVNSEVFDHTSTLRFLEKFLYHKTGKQIVETNINEWRRLVCGDLTTVFRPYHSEGIPTPEFLPKDAFMESIHKAKFKKVPDNYRLFNAEEAAAFNKDPYSSPYMPQQETGVRPACAIPYQMHADGGLNADKSAFELSFLNKKDFFGDATVGAPFNVYAPGRYQSRENPQVLEAVRTWAYAVRPGDTLQDTWPLQAFEDNRYHLRVYGPNGFFREFRGDATDPSAKISFDYQQLHGKLTGNVVLTLAGGDAEAGTVRITDHAYGAAEQTIPLTSEAGRSVVLNLAKSHGWYDFSVTIEGKEGFAKRYAGHVETGKPSFSDPYMGRI